MTVEENRKANLPVCHLNHHSCQVSIGESDNTSSVKQGNFKADESLNIRGI